VSYNRNGQVITDVGSAVARLGLSVVRSLAHALIVRQMAGAPVAAQHRETAAQLWTHTAHVASLSRLIARRVTRCNPDTALFAGLVQDVGGFYLISRARDYPALLEDGHIDADEEVENTIFDAVLRKLGVPEPVLTAAHVVWTGFLAIPPESLGDTVLLAKQLAPVASPMLRAPGEPPDHARAVIDMVIGEEGDETLSILLQESAAELASLAAALQF
jgi:hypothetical protein